MRHTDDADLVRAAQVTPAAFGALYERYHPLIFSYTHRCTHNRMQAEDIASEAFLRALQALDRYEDRGVPFSAWLFRIATNQLIQQGRRGRGITFQPLDTGQAYEGRCSGGEPGGAAVPARAARLAVCRTATVVGRPPTCSLASFLAGLLHARGGCSARSYRGGDQDTAVPHPQGPACARAYAHGRHGQCSQRQA